MSREVMQQALEALELERRMYEATDPETGAPYNMIEAITALRRALADQAIDKKAENARELGLDYEPEQQPAEEPDYSICPTCGGMASDPIVPPEHRHQPADDPPKREWVGLTDEELRELEKQFEAERVRTSDEEYLVIYPAAYWQWQRAIEAKLKEKNT